MKRITEKCKYCGALNGFPARDHAEGCPVRLYILGSESSALRAIALFEDGFTDGKKAPALIGPRSMEQAYLLGWRKARAQQEAN